MKKIFLVLGLAVILAIGSAFAYGDNGLNNVDTNNLKSLEDIENWREERMERRLEELKKAVEDGRISQEDSKTWEEHFNYMEKFHKENGFLGKGMCHDRMGNGKGMRGRHMRGY